MTFASAETSQQGSIPIELYEFRYQGLTQYFTSSESDVQVGAVLYTATQLSRSEIVDSGEIGKNNISLTAPDQFPISLLFESGPPDDVVTLSIKRVQWSALDVADTVVIWIGRIMTVNWPPQRSELACESVFTSLRQAGIRRVFTVNCPYALYGSECGVNILTFTTTVTLDSQVGNVLNASSFASKPNGWWAGGKVVWESSPGVLVKRGIKNHTGSAAEITFAMPGLHAGATLTVVPGCDHSYSTCISKFVNGDNFGGFPYMTQKNPWGASSVF